MDKRESSKEIKELAQQIVQECDSFLQEHPEGSKMKLEDALIGIHKIFDTASRIVKTTKVPEGQMAMLGFMKGRQTFNGVEMEDEMCVGPGGELIITIEPPIGGMPTIVAPMKVEAAILGLKRRPRSIVMAMRERMMEVIARFEVETSGPTGSPFFIQKKADA